MDIGLYFGSFNPVHNGHLIIASHILNSKLVDRIWFVLSPQNPFKKTTGLLNEYQRLYLINAAIDGEKNMKASNIEFSLPKPSYTINTLQYLKEKHPNHRFKIILGSDGFQNLDKWKNAEILIRDYEFIVYKRPGFEVENTFNAQTNFLNAPLLEISSTHIRSLIKEHKSIRYLVPDVVKDEIEKGAYYL